MVFTLGTLFEAGLLLVNAVAILNEEKFLKKSELANYSLCMPVINANNVHNKAHLSIRGPSNAYLCDLYMDKIELE